MKIQIEFSFDGRGNYGFKTVYNAIYDTLVAKYPHIEFTKVDLNIFVPSCNHSGGRCGTSSMNIINLDNNKTTVLTFWDRSMETTYKDLWEDLNVVHIIGGLGMYKTSEELKNEEGILHSPLLYPVEFEHTYNYIEELREPYIYSKKIKKACFIGLLYDYRLVLANILKKHPLFEIYDPTSGYRGLSYYEKMNSHALTMSFNGNGEWCIRDVESLGLGIPIIRSELKTQFYEPLIPDVDYIKGSVYSDAACFYYPGYTPNQIAEQFIEKVEEVINDEELLTNISKRNIEYYDRNLKLNNIIDNFFKVFDINILK